MDIEAFEGSGVHLHSTHVHFMEDCFSPHDMFHICNLPESDISLEAIPTR